MKRYKKFFLERQQDLEAVAPRPLLAPLFLECEHRWKHVLIATGSSNALEPGFSCRRCGTESYDPFYRQDFDMLHAERHNRSQAAMQ